MTAGYGGLHNPGDPNQLYTATFSGTSAQTATGTLTFGNLAVTNTSATTTFGATTRRQ